MGKIPNTPTGFNLDEAGGTLEKRAVTVRGGDPKLPPLINHKNS